MDSTIFDPANLIELATTQGMNVLGALLILVVGKVVGRWAKKVTTRALSKTAVDPIVASFAGRAVGALVMIFAVIAVLNRFGIQTASVIAVIGAAGLAIGLALQGTLTNFASGVMLLLFRPFSAGDLVKVGGNFGVVKSMDLFTTALDTLDNRRIIVPNSEIYGSVIENFNFNELRRVDIKVGTEYGADLDTVRRVLEQVPGMVSGITTNPPPQIFLHELADSSINWQVRVWAPSHTYWAVWQATTAATKKALDDNGLGIPFPQMDVHLDKV